MTHLQLVAAQVICCLAAFLVVLLLSGMATVVLAFAYFGARGPTAVVRRLRSRRVVELREVWPEVVDNLSSAVRAGLSLPDIAIERGTPLADVMRAQAGDVRETRKRALLESGGRREIAMMVPIVHALRF